MANPLPTPALRFDDQPDVDLQFPPLPRTVAEISAMLSTRSDVPDTPGLVKIVNLDPVMGTSVLRRINSAYYGLSRRISSVKQAVFLLGFEEVCNIVLTAALLKLRDVLKTPEQQLLFEQLMQASMGTAFYANELALHFDIPLKNGAFGAGLLHNIGRLVFLYNIPHEYEALCFSADPHRAAFPSIYTEKRIFGMDHNELGAMASAQWGLPEEIAIVIENYTAPALVQADHFRAFTQIIAVASSAGGQLAQHDPTRGAWQYSKPTLALKGLTESFGCSRSALIDFVESHHHRAASYINAMAKN